MKRLLITLGVFIAIIIGFLVLRPKATKVDDVMLSYVLPVNHINKSGLTIYDRLVAPEGYHKLSKNPGSFEGYISNYKLQPFGAKVINYDGKPYLYKAGHVGVLDVPVPENGLQQCADALIRLRAEYLWEQEKQDEIGFKFTSGHYCSWNKYAQGYRPKINGNQVSFSKTDSNDWSKANFYKYLNLIFTYSGTQSLFDELPSITDKKNLKIGDMLIYPGFPGHVMMIVAIAENERGDRLFAFAQGNTPAQSVHIIKNLAEGVSPWYAIDFDNRTHLKTPVYHFRKFDFIRFK